MWLRTVPAVPRPLLAWSGCSVTGDCFSSGAIRSILDLSEEGSSVDLSISSSKAERLGLCSRCHWGSDVASWPRVISAATVLHTQAPFVLPVTSNAHLYFVSHGLV